MYPWNSLQEACGLWFDGLRFYSALCLHACRECSEATLSLSRSQTKSKMLIFIKAHFHPVYLAPQLPLHLSATVKGCACLCVKFASDPICMCVKVFKACREVPPGCLFISHLFSLHHSSFFFQSP